jgi:butyryl-CoA dehydrogenase
MVEGRFFGTMCLSEPQAGSSLSDVTTRAVPQDDGSYRLFGNKMWISAGDHELTENIVHLVLAKIPGGPAGVKGISLFVVPKVVVETGERNDVVLAGPQPQDGLPRHGQHAAELRRGRAPARRSARGGRLPRREAHQGLKYMFHMMNEARVGVGLGATCLGYTGYLHALDYAKGRPQGRPVNAKDPASPQVPIISHPDVRRMLLAQKAYVEGALALNLYCGRLLDEERTGETEQDRTRSTLLLDVLTPIAKSWPSQWCLEANSLAIQVLGGYGYTREYPVEQFYRDNRLNPIHEGTHGIQGLDLLGRKVVMQGGAGLQLLVETMAATTDRATAAGGELAELAGSCGPSSTGCLPRRRGCSAPGTSRSRWPTPPSTSRRSGTSCWRGSGSSSCWPPTAARATSTTASARPGGSSSAGSCPAPVRSSTCSRASTPRRWTPSPPGSDRVAVPRPPGRARSPQPTADERWASARRRASLWTTAHRLRRTP